MTRITKRIVRWLLLPALVSSTPSLAAQGEVYPQHPVRIVVPFPAGGTADILPRILAEKLSDKWHQPVIVDNRPGAAGNIGAEIVFKAEPDGYTLLSTPPPPLAMNPSLYAHLPYDAEQFVPISIIASSPSVLVLNPRVPAANLKEFIEYARSHPGLLNYASQGSGSTSHLTTEMLKRMAELQLNHIPYKGSAPALTDLIAGQVDLMFDNLGSSLQPIRSGKLRAIAVGSEHRAAALPGIPAMNEILPRFLSVAWYAVMAPPHTPQALATQISSDLKAILSSASIGARFNDLSCEPMGTSPEQALAQIREDTKRWRNVIHTAGARVD